MQQFEIVYKFSPKGRNRYTVQRFGADLNGVCAHLLDTLASCGKPAAVIVSAKEVEPTGPALVAIQRPARRARMIRGAGE
jgi:hypothetical protein